MPLLPPAPLSPPPLLLKQFLPSHGRMMAQHSSAPTAATPHHSRHPARQMSTTGANSSGDSNLDAPGATSQEARRSADPTGRQSSVQGGDLAAGTGGVGASSTAAATGRQGGYRGKVPSEPDLSDFHHHGGRLLCGLTGWVVWRRA
jgi:hypothetical protein